MESARGALEPSGGRNLPPEGDPGALAELDDRTRSRPAPWLASVILVGAPFLLLLVFALLDRLLR